MHPTIKTLLEAARKHDVEVEHKGNGHYHIKGKILVNYYPLSHNQTAYIQNTRGGRQRVSPEEAVQLALAPPPVIKDGHRRKTSYRGVKRKLLELYHHCRWCGKRLTSETATVDHIVPLHRGGLDHPSNYCLACEPCNLRRGHDMPELNEETPPVSHRFITSENDHDSGPTD